MNNMEKIIANRRMVDYLLGRAEDQTTYQLYDLLQQKPDSIRDEIVAVTVATYMLDLRETILKYAQDINNLLFITALISGKNDESVVRMEQELHKCIMADNLLKTIVDICNTIIKGDCSFKDEYVSVA